MRVLFTALGSPGHAYPLIPLAIAARDAGHEVHFAAGEHVHAPLAAHGLRPLRPADSFYEIYADDLVPELERLRPDLVIHEWGVPGAAVAAHRVGVPGLWHGFGRMFPDGIGLENPARVVGPSARPHLDICPPSLQDKEFLATQERIELRPVPFSEPSDPVGLGGVRPIYLTLGTAFGTPELLTTVVEGLALLRMPVVVATGRVRPDELGPVPDNVTLRPWVDQAELLHHVAAVVHHGGSGTTLGALAVGVPQLILPQGADQYANAEAVTAAGAAATLPPEDLSPAAVASRTHELLRTASYRDAARVIAAEIAGMPGPAEVARALPDHAR